MEIPQLISISEELTDWAHTTLHNLEVQGDSRSRYALGCLDIALEHREAIVSLVSQKLYGSAFALARSVFESYVRGVWLYRCAEARDIEEFEQDKFDRYFNDLLKDIEKLADFSHGIFSILKDQAWKSMNSYTHSGIRNVERRFKEDTVQSNYRQCEIEEVLNFANAFGLLSILQFVSLSTNQELPMIVLEKTKAYIEGLEIEGII